MLQLFAMAPLTAGHWFSAPQHGLASAVKVSSWLGEGGL